MLLLLGVSFIVAATPDSLNDVTPMQHLYIMKEIKPGIERVGIVWNPATHDDAVLTKIRRAATSLSLQLFLAEVGDLSDIAPQFRTLVRTHKVEVIWVIKNDGLVDASAGKKFLIENTMKAGIPLFAPSQDWVDNGAFVSLKKQDGNLHLIVNKSAAAALSLTVPDAYLERTEFLAAN
ncbi:MAG: ABC transporter substrate binding protein [Rhodothermales bacterium]